MVRYDNRFGLWTHSRDLYREGREWVGQRFKMKDKVFVQVKVDKGDGDRIKFGGRVVKTYHNLSEDQPKKGRD